MYTYILNSTRWTRGAGPAVGITVSAQFSGIILWLKCSMIFSSIFFRFLEISIFSEKFQYFFFNQTLYTSSECSSRGVKGFNLMTNDVPKHRERFWGAGWTQFSASLYRAVCFQNKRSAWHHRFWDIALTENRPKAGTISKRSFIFYEIARI